MIRGGCSIDINGFLRSSLLRLGFEKPGPPGGGVVIIGQAKNYPAVLRSSDIIIENFFIVLGLEKGFEMNKLGIFACTALCLVFQTGCGKVVVETVKTVIVNSGDDLLKASTKVAKPVISNSTDDIAKIGVKAAKPISKSGNNIIKTGTVASTEMLYLQTSVDLAFQSVQKVHKLFNNLPFSVRMKITSDIKDRLFRNEQALDNEMSNMDKNTNSEQACKQTRERIERITKENEAIAHLLKNIG